MKKMLAFFTAAICCLGVFSACGNKKSSNTDEAPASGTVDVSATSANAESVKETSGDEFADVFRTFYLSGDPVQMLEASLPDVVISSIENIGGIDTISKELSSAVAQSASYLPEMNDGTIEFVSDRECTPEFRSKLEKLYSSYYDVYRTMESSGISYADYLYGKVDEKSMKLLTDAFDKYEKICAGEDADVTMTLTFEDVKVVTFSINGEQAEFVMYKVAGDEWKLDTIGLAVFEY